MVEQHLDRTKGKKTRTVRKIKKDTPCPAKLIISLDNSPTGIPSCTLLDCILQLCKVSSISVYPLLRSSILINMEHSLIAMCKLPIPKFVTGISINGYITILKKGHTLKCFGWASLNIYHHACLYHWYHVYQVLFKRLEHCCWSLRHNISPTDHPTFS